MSDEDLAQSLRSALTAIEGLQQRLNGLEARTDLLSPSFLRRSFAVLGHYLVASLIIVVPIYAVILVMVVVISLAVAGR